MSVISFSFQKYQMIKLMLKNELVRLSESISDFIQSTDMRKISSKFLHKRNCFLIGRGIAYDLAQEAALKIKEVHIFKQKVLHQEN